MSAADAIHVAQYEAWLEVEMKDSDSSLMDSLAEAQVTSAVAAGSLRVPICSFEINAAIDGLPTAAVHAATGLDVTATDVSPSPVHALYDSGTLSSKDYIHAFIMFRNAAGGQEPVCIFDGFLSTMNLAYHVTGVQLVFNLIHWAKVLDMCPLVCTTLTSEGMQSHAAAFLHRIISADGGANAAAKTTFAMRVQQTLDRLKEQVSTGDSDVLAAIFKPVLQRLHEYNLTEARKLPTIGEAFVPSQGDLPAGYRIEDILASLTEQRNGFSVPTPGAASGGAAFPGVYFRKDLPNIIDSTSDDKTPRTVATRLVELTTNSMGETKVAQGTAWSFLREWASRFSLTIVPRVHEIRLVPTWAVAHVPDGQALSLDYLISASQGHSAQSPSAAVIAISSPSQPVKSSLDVFNVMAIYGQASRGIYVDPNRGSGPIDMQILPIGLSGQMDPASVNTSDIHDEYAKHVFWLKHYAAESAILLSPIRFDLCPGTLVRYNSGVNAQTRTENFGYVQQITWHYAAAQGATASIRVGFVRPVSSQERDLPAKHFYYDGSPFVKASWLSNEQFRTFQAS